MVSHLEPQATLPWLIRLRWWMCVGQACGLVAVQAGRPLDGRGQALAALVVLASLSNAGLSYHLRGSSSPRGAPLLPRRLLGAILSGDVVLLTAILGLSGGVKNPFTIFYLVFITLSAVVLEARWTLFIAMLSVVAFAVLFVVPGGDSGHCGGGGGAIEGFDAHLQGMFLAFVLATALCAYFVGQISRAISQQRRYMLRLSEANARNARLAALTTLAAGTAHELGSPLATIAIAAHEASLAAQRLAGARHIADDLQLILMETKRCRHILNRMSVPEEAGGPQSQTCEELAQRLRDRLPREAKARVDVVALSLRAHLLGPAEELLRCVLDLVDNALSASADGQTVAVSIGAVGRQVFIKILDRGVGIAPHHLEKVGEPFFTTKPPGTGMGLGVFLARAFAQNHGGGLTIASRAGRGTEVEMRFPCGPQLEAAG